jgi:hypothetical protein
MSYSESTIKFVEWVSIIDTIVLIIVIVRAAILWFMGISPVLFRLGNGLAKSKIAVFAKNDNLGSLRSLLLDSKLFKSKNILEIASKGDIGKAEEASVYLVYWHDWVDNIEEILSKKPDKCALIVYAPYYLDKIPVEQMKNLDDKRHTAVTNFRGRLLNDIVTSMITTSYEPS